MVLTNGQAEVTPKGFLEQRNFNSFIVLDSTSILNYDEGILFEYSIEILNLVRVVLKANKMCADFRSDFQINTAIYYKAMDSVLNNMPFTDAELESFIHNEQKKEDFLTFSRGLANLENDFYLPYQIDLILLGVKIDKYNNLNEIEKDAFLDSYGDIAYDVRSKRINFRDYILKANELLISTGIINIVAE